MQIPDLLRAHGIDFRRHGESSLVTEGWVGVVCPWCGVGTGKHGLGIHLRTGKLSCWKCGGHSLASLLHAAGGLSWDKAKKAAGDVSRQRAPDTPARGRLVLPSGVGELEPAHRRYLESRGFDPDELAAFWKLQGIGRHPRLAWRIFIPVHQDGEVVSWTTRAIGDVPHGQRYRGAERDQEAVPRRDVLYGEDHVRHAVVVHEGQFDVYRTGPGAVCTAGTGFSSGQIRRLSRYPLRVICFDQGAAAQIRARELADALAPFPGETLVARLSAKDAATAPESEIRELRRFLA